MGTKVQARTHPRRQERGKQRMESLLKAAEEVFAEVGFERATTNLIAARASVSPGTLYQFYPNKETMAESLAVQYAERLQALHAQAFDYRTRPHSLTALVDATVDPFLEFHRGAPAFDALFFVAAVSPEPAGRVKLLHETFIESDEAARGSGANAGRDDVVWAAEGAVCVFRGMLPLVSSLNGSRRKRAIRELKRILTRYLRHCSAHEEHNRSRHLERPRNSTMPERTDLSAQIGQGDERDQKRQVIPDGKLVPEHDVLGHEHDDQEQTRGHSCDHRASREAGGDPPGAEGCQRADREAREHHRQRKRHGVGDTRVFRPRAAHYQARDTHDGYPHGQSCDDAKYVLCHPRFLPDDRSVPCRTRGSSTLFHRQLGV